MTDHKLIILVDRPSSDTPIQAAEPLLKLLARGECMAEATEPFIEEVWRAFGQHANSDADIPVAAVARLAEIGSAPGVWLRGDPVWQVVDRDRIYLSNPAAPLSADDRAEIMGAFMAHFGDDGWHLEFAEDGSGRLGAPGPLTVTTTPLHSALGSDVHTVQPQGEDRLLLQGFLTELQMLLHGLDFNRRREESGAGPVNGFWLWGVGELPAATGQVQVTQLVSEHPFAIGMAQLHGIPLARVGAARTFHPEGGMLLTLSAEELTDTALFANIWTQLVRREWREVQVVLVGTGEWRMAPGHRWRWWRRQPDLQRQAGR